MRYLSIINETITDGDGMRTSIYVSGCSHQCHGCHNPQTWDSKNGTKITPEFIDELIIKIKQNPLLSGVTFTGGDPLDDDNAEDLLWILKKFKAAGINVWCYTGYVIEDLLVLYPQRECLLYIDVLVDGPFEEDLKDPDLVFIGSSNQRIIRLLGENSSNEFYELPTATH